MNNQPITKTCTRCHQTQPLTNYHRKHDSKDGHHTHCKQCRRNIDRKRYETNREHRKATSKAWREANQTRHKQQQRQWRQANNEQLKTKKHEYYKANREQNRARTDAWAKANPQRIAYFTKRWRKANPERVAQYGHTRRARKAAAVPQRWKPTPTPNHLCYWCGTQLTPTTTHKDHIMPIALHGPDTPNNTVNTCNTCNLTKNKTHPLVWIAHLASDN